MLKKGDKAPDFSLLNQDGKPVTLSEFKGKRVVIFFYSKDSTPGCTRQAMGYSKSMEKYKELNMEVIGISKDSVASHKRFADRYNLEITLLSDEERKVCELYDVIGTKIISGSEKVVTLRSSFIIDENGYIADARYKVKPDTDSGEILETLIEKRTREF